MPILNRIGRLIAAYLQQQFELLLQNHGVPLEVGVSHQPIPVHFSFAENDHIEGEMSAERRAHMREVFDLPDLSAMHDGIANGTATVAQGLGGILRRLQSGYVRNYAAWVVAGAIVVILWVGMGGAR